MSNQIHTLPIKGETRHDFINRQLKIRRELKEDIYKKTNFLKRLFCHIESDLNDSEIKAIYSEADKYLTDGIFS